jgi:hypothetical protein
MPSPSAGAAGDDVGSAGERGQVKPSDGYGLSIFPTLPSATGEFNPIGASADGSLIIGTVRTPYVGDAIEPEPGDTEDTIVYWTPEGGTRALPFPTAAKQIRNAAPLDITACIAENGERAVIAVHDINADDVFEAWSFVPDGKSQRLTGPDGLAAVGLRGCSADATRAVFQENPDNQMVRLLYWQLDRDMSALTAVELPTPGIAALMLFKDAPGGRLEIQSTSSFEYVAYDWTAEQGATGPARTPCGDLYSSYLTSGDGSKTVWCDDPAGFTLWTGGTPTLLGPYAEVGGATPREMSRDGSTILGLKRVELSGGDVSFTNAVWRAGEPMRIADLPAGSTTSFLAEDGKTAYVTAEEGLYRWSIVDDGLQLLEGLVPSDVTRLTAGSADGTLATGVSTPAGSDPYDFDGVGVVWDAVGVRDVLAELRAAHVDLLGTVAFSPDYPYWGYIWRSGATIRMVGRCIANPELGDGPACIVELPAR